MTRTNIASIIVVAALACGTAARADWSAYLDRLKGAAGDAGVQRDPAGVAPHHLDDHHAVV